MSDSTAFDEIARHMARTARAHHEATGGVNPAWAEWYAERLVDDVNATLDTDIDIEELAEWLTEADRRYREEPQTESWPKAYARWLIAEQSS